MSGMDDEDEDFRELDGERREALGQLHDRMTQDIAEAHAAGDRPRAEQLLGYRQMVSGGLAGGGPLEEPFGGPGREERDALEARRAALTRELHEAVARKDSFQAGRLDRERNELTEGLYGNGEIVGAGGRSL